MLLFSTQSKNKTNAAKTKRGTGAVANAINSKNSAAKKRKPTHSRRINAAKERQSTGAVANSLNAKKRKPTDSSAKKPKD